MVETIGYIEFSPTEKGAELYCGFGAYRIVGDERTIIKTTDNRQTLGLHKSPEERALPHRGKLFVA